MEDLGDIQLGGCLKGWKFTSFHNVWVIIIFKYYWVWKFWKGANWLPPTIRHRRVLYAAKKFILNIEHLFIVCTRASCKSITLCKIRRMSSRGEEKTFLKFGKCLAKEQRRGLKIRVFVGSLLWMGPYPDLICVSPCY